MWDYRTDNNYSIPELLLVFYVYFQLPLVENYFILNLHGCLFVDFLDGRFISAWHVPSEQSVTKISN
jgi:hypothetical protein